MGSVTREFADYISELLEPVGHVVCSRLFGGVGIKIDGIQCALIIDDTLYFRVDDDSRPDYAALGSEPFSYTTKQRQVFVESYYAVPADWLEDAETLCQWATRAKQAKRPETHRRKRRKTS